MLGCLDACLFACLCRLEYRFKEICWILSEKVGQPVAAWGNEGQRVGQPVAACGNELRPSRSPIEEDKMIR